MAGERRASSLGRRILLGGLGLGSLCLAVWAVGLVIFAANLPSEVADPARRSDAIVVLTGGSGRVRQGLELLAQERAQQLFVSGADRGVEVGDLLRVDRIAPPELACCVALGYEAGDTRGNALETAEWMREQGFASLRLVTASYHMPRSLLEFRIAMPDIEILPHPVFTKHFKQADWWRWPGSARLLASEYHKYIAAWLRGRLTDTGS
jgi:uncharacterized SAM-binding protein YcdF (DUF218 family)